MKTLRDRPRLLPTRVTTIGELALVHRPRALPSARLPFERHVFSVVGEVSVVHRHRDRTLHLIIRDQRTGRHLVADAPSLACTRGAKPYRRRQIGTARRRIQICARAKVAGVAFFDVKRRRIDGASNGIELNPILTFQCVSTEADVAPPPPPAPPAPPPPPPPAPSSPAPPPPPARDSYVVAAAGDLCGQGSSCNLTANVVNAIDPDRVLPLGDNAYESGTRAEYNAYYDPFWGVFKAKTSPVPGNHEYNTTGALGYFTYFGANAPGPFYSFDLGSWHVIALASEVGVSPAAGGAEETWLRNDLIAHPAPCTLAYWHEPRFASGSNDGTWEPVWDDLYAAGAELVLNGHVHDYERFAPQNPDGVRDDARGIVEFIVGTGGRSHFSLGMGSANSVAHNDTDFGVLKLTLHPRSYDFEFVSATGSYRDAGSGNCH